MTTVHQITTLRMKVHCDTGWVLFSTIPLLAVITTYVNGQYSFVYDVGSWNESVMWQKNGGKSNSGAAADRFCL